MRWSGCGSGGARRDFARGLYHKVDGTWRYRSQPLAETDAASFVSRADYAKSGMRVWHRGEVVAGTSR